MNLSGFVGGTRGQRLTWLRGSIYFERIMEKYPVVLAWEQSDLDDLWREGSMIYAPGYSGSLKIDLCLEFAMGGEFPAVEDMARAISHALVPEHRIREVRDRFWPDSARSVLEALFAGAVYNWGSRIEKMKQPCSVDSLTSTFLSMLDDLAAARPEGVSLSKESGVPAWFSLLGRRHRNLLNSLILKNSPATAGSIMAEVSTFSEPLRAFSRGKGIQPILGSMRGPLLVYLPAMDAQALFILLKAFAVSSRTFSIFAPEVGEWEGECLLSLRKAAGGSPFSDLVWTDGSLIPEGLSGGSMFWGHTSDRRVLGEFNELVMNTAGRVSGLLTREP